MIYQIIKQLEATNSRNEKIAILESNLNNKLLKRVLNLALNPHIQFYQRKLPDPTEQDVCTTLDYALDQLDPLINRTITGNQAKSWLADVLGYCDDSDNEVVARVVQKDLKCGVNSSTVNKVFPGLIPEFPVMLASAYDERLVKKIKYPAFVQTKMDGMRVAIIVRSGAVEFRSRNGKEIIVENGTLHHELKLIANNVGEDENVVLDGELLVVGKDGKYLTRKEGNGILNKCAKGTATEEEASRVRVVLWDFIPLEYFEKGFWDNPYSSRLDRLEGAVDSDYVKTVDGCIVSSLNGVNGEFQAALARGEEGIILKALDAPWEDKRSKNLIKFKNELDMEAVVVDWLEGSGKYKGKLGSLACKNGDIEFNVGTGFSDEDRETIGREVIGKIVTVKYNEIIHSKQSDVKSLFLPVFVEIRMDKDYI